MEMLKWKWMVLGALVCIKNVDLKAGANSIYNY